MHRNPAIDSGPHAPLRVVIADDHPFYREGLAGLLRESGIDVVDTVPNGTAAIRAVERGAPDVVLIDLNMPGLHGLDAVRHLTRATPTTPVVVLSVSAQEDDVTDALLAGASGYVLKDGPVEAVVGAIRAVAAGDTLICERLAGLLLALSARSAE